MVCAVGARCAAGAAPCRAVRTAVGRKGVAYKGEGGIAWGPANVKGCKGLIGFLGFLHLNFGAARQ